MTLKELEQRIGDSFESDMRLMRAKNHDYAGDKDALYNLRRFGFFGIVVRLSDKFSRLEQFAKQRKLRVKDEGIRETLRDIRIYSHLAEILLSEEMRPDTKIREKP